MSIKRAKWVGFFLMLAMLVLLALVRRKLDLQGQ